MPCSQFEALFLSAAHTEADIDATVAAARGGFGLTGILHQHLDVHPARISGRLRHDAAK